MRLRPFRESDADDVAAGCADPLTQRFMPLLPSPYTRDDALWWISDGCAGRVRRRAARATRSPTRHRPAARRRWASAGCRRAGAGRDRLLGGAVGARAAASPPRRPGRSPSWRLRPGHVPAGPAHRAGERGQPAGRARRRVPPGGRRAAAAAARRDGSRYDLIVWGPPGHRPGRAAPAGAARPARRRRADRRRGRPAPAGGRRRRLHRTGCCTTCPTSWPPASRRGRRTGRTIERAVRPTPSHAWLAGERADLVIIDAATGASAGDIGLYYQEPHDRAGHGRLQPAAGVARPWLRHAGGRGCWRDGRSRRPASPG